jgi:hypothetical protein
MNEPKVTLNTIPEDQKADVRDLLGLDEKKDELKSEDTKIDKTPKDEPKGVQGEGTVPKETEQKAEDDTEKKETGAEEDKGVPDLVSELSRLSELLTKQQDDYTQFLPKEEQKKEEPKKEEKQTVEKEEEKVQELLKPIPAETQSFIKDTDFEGSLDDKDRKTLQNILTNVVAVTRKQAIQDIMSFMPRLISYNIQGAIAAQEFWSTNPKLKVIADKHPGIRQYVSFRANELQKNNPQMPIGAVYAQTQKEVTQLLKAQLDVSDQETSVKNGGKPGLARKPGAQRGDGKTKNDGLTDVQKEILELM